MFGLWCQPDIGYEHQTELLFPARVACVTHHHTGRRCHAGGWRVRPFGLHIYAPTILTFPSGVAWGHRGRSQRQGTTPFGLYLVTRIDAYHRAAVPSRGQSSLITGSLLPKRDCCVRNRVQARIIIYTIYILYITYIYGHHIKQTFGILYYRETRQRRRQ